MTNVFNKPEKAPMKHRLFEIGVEALESEGWTVERAPGVRAFSVRRITKGKESKLVSIRTTQDTWIAFPRLDDDKSWKTLSQVDAVVAVSVDNRERPEFAKVHMIDGDEMRGRFDRTYAARKNAGHSIPVGRGVWLSLYDKENTSVPRLVGAGAGRKHPPVAEVPLHKAEDAGFVKTPAPVADFDIAPLTVAQAKLGLAKAFGIDPESVKITIEA